MSYDRDAQQLRMERRTRSEAIDAAWDVAAHQERDRLLTLARQRAAYEASAAAHHAGNWQAAYERHLTRHGAMIDLIDVLSK